LYTERQCHVGHNIRVSDLLDIGSIENRQECRDQFVELCRTFLSCGRVSAHTPKAPNQWLGLMCDLERYGKVSFEHWHQCLHGCDTYLLSSHVGVDCPHVTKLLDLNLCSTAQPTQSMHPTRTTTTTACTQCDNHHRDTRVQCIE
jgi:hypothetical protein